MTENKKSIIRIAVLLLAVLFILVGVFSGELKTVFQKAVAVCYSCIGIAG